MNKMPSNLLAHYKNMDKFSIEIPFSYLRKLESKDQVLMYLTRCGIDLDRPWKREVFHHKEIVIFSQEKLRLRLKHPYDYPIDPYKDVIVTPNKFKPDMDISELEKKTKEQGWIPNPKWTTPEDLPKYLPEHYKYLEEKSNEEKRRELLRKQYEEMMLLEKENPLSHSNNRLSFFEECLNQL